LIFHHEVEVFEVGVTTFILEGVTEQVTTNRDGGRKFRRTAGEYIKGTNRRTGKVATGVDGSGDAYVGTGAVVQRANVVKTQVGRTDVAGVSAVNEVAVGVRRGTGANEGRRCRVANFHHLGHTSR